MHNVFACVQVCVYHAYCNSHLKAAKLILTFTLAGDCNTLRSTLIPHKAARVLQKHWCSHKAFYSAAFDSSQLFPSSHRHAVCLEEGECKDTGNELNAPQCVSQSG